MVQIQIKKTNGSKVDFAIPLWVAQGDEKDTRYLVALSLGLSTGVSFATPLTLFDSM